MKLTGDFHTHTILSHGKGTVMDNVAAAQKRGLKCVAITDHGPGHLICGLSKDDIKQLRILVEQARKAFPEMNIYAGVEANLIDLNGKIDIADRYLDYFDVILMGYHEAVKTTGFGMELKLVGRNLLGRMLKTENEKRKKANTEAFIRAMERYPIDAVTHIGCKMSLDERAVALAAAQTDTLVEMNTKHLTPDSDLIEKTRATGCRYLISSDAHRPEAVGEVKEAMLLAEQAEIPPERIANVNTFYIPKKYRS